MIYDHDDPAHIYSGRNRSGCDKFYCLGRFSRMWRFRLSVTSATEPKAEGEPHRDIRSGTDWLDEVRQHVDEWNSTMLVRHDVPKLIDEIVRLREALTAATVALEAVWEFENSYSAWSFDEVRKLKDDALAAAVAAASDGEAER